MTENVPRLIAVPADATPEQFKALANRAPRETDTRNLTPSDHSTITGQLRRVLRRRWADDPRKSVAQAIAERLVREALKRGGKAAVRAIGEIADRTEGRPAQRLELGDLSGAGGITVNVRRVE